MSFDEPHLTTKAAIGDGAKGVADRLGKSISYVQQMTEGREKDRYSRFLQVYYASSDAGAEVYFADFQRRHFERMAASGERQKDESKLIEDVLQLGADFHSAAYNKDDGQTIRRGSKLINAIGALIAYARKRHASSEDLYEESHAAVAMR